MRQMVKGRNRLKIQHGVRSAVENRIWEGVGRARQKRAFPACQFRPRQPSSSPLESQRSSLATFYSCIRRIMTVQRRVLSDPLVDRPVRSLPVRLLVHRRRFATVDRRATLSARVPFDGHHVVAPLRRRHWVVDPVDSLDHRGGHQRCALRSSCLRRPHCLRMRRNDLVDAHAADPCTTSMPSPWRRSRRV